MKLSQIITMYNPRDSLDKVLAGVSRKKSGHLCKPVNL
jgi:hypothetical protein